MEFESCCREQLSKDNLRRTRSRIRLSARKFWFFARSHDYPRHDESVDRCVTRASYRCNWLPLITHELRRDSRWEPREATARRIAQLPDAVIPLRPACRSKSPMERGGFTFVNWHKKTEPRDRDDSQLDFFFSLLSTTVELRCTGRGESALWSEAYFQQGLFQFLPSSFNE